MASGSAKGVIAGLVIIFAVSTGWSNLTIREEEVLRKAQADLQSLLVGGRIIQLDLDAKPEGHPWQQFAGMFADDPDWEAFQASLQQYREDIDRAITEE
jgi:hypothetical protein